MHIANHPELKGDRCPKCSGTGKGTLKLRASGGGNVLLEVNCTICYGTGLVNSPNACKKCHGKGTRLVAFRTKLMLEATCEHCHGSGLEPL